MFTILGEKLANTDIVGNRIGSSVGGTLPLELVLNQNTSMLLSPEVLYDEVNTKERP